MSLIAGDTYLTRLYQLAQVSPDVEHEALSFWDYYLSKRVFTDDQFHVDAEKPASSETDPRRRVDRVVRYFENGTLQLQVLIFVEAKKHGATRNKILEVERQAHEACGTSCGATGHSHVYAMTIWGTRARLWKFDASSGSLTPLFGEGEYGHLDSYVDANSSRAVQIKDGLNSMKALPPSLYHGQTYEQIGATRFVEPIQVAHTAPGPNLSNEASDQFTTAQMDGEWHLHPSRNQYYRYDKKRKEWEWATQQS